ncbi:MAG: F0F1 ATP synthase subunit delta [Candidatus Omnitrophica bacterium]|nr:F0F1 ATP synthase subunit delta [Candidatus Omnitrophota bacterium]
MIFLLLIFIQVVVFATLVLVLRNVLKRHFGTATSHLDVLTQDSERRLNEAKKRTEEANAYYEETIAKAKLDAEKVKQQLIDEGVKEKQDLLDRARKESEEIMERAKSARELIEEELEQRIKDAAKDISLGAIQAALSGKVNEGVQSEWISELLASGFDGLSRLNVPEQVKKIEITSALPLTPAQRKTILTKLSERVGRSLEFEEKLDPKLILGIRASMGSVVVDGSLLWKLKEALEHVRIEKND